MVRLHHHAHLHLKKHPHFRKHPSYDLPIFGYPYITPEPSPVVRYTPEDLYYRFRVPHVRQADPFLLRGQVARPVLHHRGRLFKAHAAFAMPPGMPGGAPPMPPQMMPPQAPPMMQPQMPMALPQMPAPQVPPMNLGSMVPNQSGISPVIQQQLGDIQQQLDMLMGGPGDIMSQQPSMANMDPNMMLPAPPPMDQGTVDPNLADQIAHEVEDILQRNGLTHQDIGLGQQGGGGDDDQGGGGFGGGHGGHGGGGGGGGGEHYHEQQGGGGDDDQGGQQGGGGDQGGGGGGGGQDQQQGGGGGGDEGQGGQEGGGGGPGGGGPGGGGHHGGGGPGGHHGHGGGGPGGHHGHGGSHGHGGDHGGGGGGGMHGSGHHGGHHGGGGHGGMGGGMGGSHHGGHGGHHGGGGGGPGGHHGGGHGGGGMGGGPGGGMMGGGGGGHHGGGGPGGGGGGHHGGGGHGGGPGGMGGGGPGGGGGMGGGPFGMLGELVPSEFAYQLEGNNPYRMDPYETHREGGHSRHGYLHLYPHSPEGVYEAGEIISAKGHGFLPGEYVSTQLYTIVHHQMGAMMNDATLKQRIGNSIVPTDGAGTTETKDIELPTLYGQDLAVVFIGQQSGKRIIKRITVV